MPPGVPAHDALWTALGVRCGSAPDPSWKRPRGRPRTSWAEQLRRDLDGKGLWKALVSGYGEEKMDGVRYEPLLFRREIDG